MNKVQKNLVLVIAIMLGLSLAPSTMAHQYKHKQYHDNYPAHHCKHQQKNRHKQGHSKHDRYNPGPHERNIRHGYYNGPYRHGDGLDIVFRYHID